MAAAALAPRVRIMAVCDSVRERGGEPGVFDLRGVRQQIQADVFPFAPRRLALFLLLSSPRLGMYPGYLRVINDQSEKAVFYSHLKPTPRFQGEVELLAIRLRIRCSFATPGRYTVQVCFFQEVGTDIVKGETAIQLVQS